MRRKNSINSLEDILKKISNKPKLKKKLESIEILNKLDEILGSNLVKYVSNKYFKMIVVF